MSKVKIYEVETEFESGEYKLMVADDSDVVNTFWDEYLYFIPNNIVEKYNIEEYTCINNLNDEAREAVLEGRECVDVYFGEWVKFDVIDPKDMYYSSETREFFKGENINTDMSCLWVYEGGQPIMYRITDEAVEIDLDAAEIDEGDLDNYTIEQLKEIAKGQK
jgi:hypothetical protein